MQQRDDGQSHDADDSQIGDVERMQECLRDRIQAVHDRGPGRRVEQWISGRRQDQWRGTR